MISWWMPFVWSYSGVDVSTLVSQQDWECMHSSYDINFMVVRAWHSNGVFDTNSPQTLKNAQRGGIKYTDVYLFPCTSKSASSQVDSMMNSLKAANATYGMVWLDIESNSSPNCGWTAKTATQNCDFIMDLAQSVEINGKKVGIYSNNYEWTTYPMRGDRYGCTQASKYPLWYAHYDKSASFNDWNEEKFGGWTSPTIKQYTDDVKYCVISKYL